MAGEQIANKAAEKAKNAIVEGAKKLIKKYGWGYVLQWIPGLGWLIPGDLMLVWRTLEGNITSVEGILMLSIAALSYLIQIGIGITEIWFDLGLFATLITWIIAGFFWLWLKFRGSGSMAATTKTEDAKEPQKNKSAAPKPQKKAA